jgi:predicted aconitase with swiveling domain
MIGSTTIPIAATTLVEGRAEATVFAPQEPLSFWGGLDAVTGIIIDRRHPQAGRSVSNRILVMQSGRGSSSGSSVLAEAIRLGTGPAGIVLLSRDAIVTVGAMVASELYRKECPVVLVRAEDWSRVAQAGRLSIVAEDERAEVLVSERDTGSDRHFALPS